MLQEINLFDQQKVGLKLSNHILPSYKALIGNKIGKLYVESLCRKNNRNLLKCVCQCGRVQYLYRWQLKNKNCCEICSQKNECNNQNVSKQFFNAIESFAKLKLFDFSITYDYANDIFKKQNKRCALTRVLLNTSQNQKKRNAFLSLIQPKKGYVVGNVQWVCDKVANMKNDLSDKDFVDLCKKITKYYSKSKKIKLIQQNIF